MNNRILQMLGMALACGVPYHVSTLHAAAGADEKVWHQESGFRWKTAENPDHSTKPGFQVVHSDTTGITFTNSLPAERAIGNHNLMNGSGVALGDFDSDGLCDIYLCNIGGRNALYKNLGNWKFQNVTEQAGLGGGGRSSTGASFADLDGNGTLDLVLTSCGGPNSCFLNDGKGHFRELVLPPGDVTRTGSTSLALADVDGDGDLDLYIANYGENSIMRSGGTPATRFVNGREEVIGRYRNRVKIRPDGKMIELGEPDVLYLNDGRGNFTPVSWTGGAFLDEDGRPLTAALWDFGLAVQFRDLNNDRFPDIYVCNDFQTPDRVWINDGKGNFHALPRLSLRHTSNFSMSVDFADLNRDGNLDFFLADMLSRSHKLQMVQMDGNERAPHFIGAIDDRPQMRRNSLMLGRGDGTFTDVANYAGVQASEWTWSGVFIDVDLDGFEDLLIGNGHPFDTQDLDAIEKNRSTGKSSIEEGLRKLLLYPKLEVANCAFRNRGDLTFEEVGKSWGFDSLQVSNGIALADLDNDGDLDVVVNCLNGPPLIYRNLASGPRVAVRLKGNPGNSQGVGSLITVRGGAVPLQSQEILSGGRYLSGDDAMRTFAAGSMDAAMTIEVNWRSGKRSEIKGVKAGRIYEVDEASASASSHAASPPKTEKHQPLFEDVSNQIQHLHQEALFDDFERQPLLPRRFSQIGPGVGFCDLDGDGHDDLFIGSGRGGKPALYLGSGASGFATNRVATGLPLLNDDLLGISLFADADGQRSLLAALSNYESPTNGPGSLLTFRIASGNAKTTSSPLDLDDSTPAAIAVADVDGDGILEFFLGGRLRPGRYPEPARSGLYRRSTNGWQRDPQVAALLEPGQLITTAIFSDLNGDGYPELILASEWGPVRILENRKGTFVEAGASWGLTGENGWWTSLAAVDLDGDGKLDLVAGGWGLNTQWRASREEPMAGFYGDFDGNGIFDFLEARANLELGRVVPIRNFELIGKHLPFTKLAFESHHSYAAASVEQILGESIGNVKKVTAANLATRAWLNKDHKLVELDLPREVQWAPTFAIVAADFDGEGNEDLFLSQNFFAMRSEDGRQDAGRGLLLLGRGRGLLQPATMTGSGIGVFGEQRGAAAGDFDEDGRTDLVVSQNGAATRLFKNSKARQGLRLRLKGPKGNPDGLGAVVRLGNESNPGPAREIHGGNGGLSQDSTVQVLSLPENVLPIKLQISWPGGRTTRVDVPSGAKEVQVDLDGRLTVLR